MPQKLQNLILEGLKGLPPEAVSEITSYIFFMRKKYLQPTEYDEDLEILLKTNVSRLRNTELRHLEEEFRDYEKEFPRE